MIRSLRPTDLIPFLQFRNTAPLDCAVTSSGYPASSPGLGSLFNQSVGLYGGTLTWALVERSQMCGIVSVTVGSANARWEIYHLIVDADRGFRRVLRELLDHLSVMAARDRVPIVHLKVDVASPAVQPVLDSSFVRYAQEDVYLLGSVSPAGPDAVLAIRPRESSDDLNLFQLYSAFRPVTVRQYEGLTQREWRNIDGWIDAPLGLRRLGLSPRRDFVVQVGDSIVGWIQVDRYHNTVRAELDTPARQEMDAIFDFASGQTDVESPAHWIVRDHQGWLGQELAQRGVESVSTHLLFARPLSMRVAEPELVPMSV